MGTTPPRDGQVGRNDKSIDIFLAPAAQTPDLEAMWSELQARSDTSLFLWWSWIGRWLARLPSHIDVQLVRAECRGLVVGLALAVVAPLRRCALHSGMGRTFTPPACPNTTA